MQEILLFAECYVVGVGVVWFRSYRSVSVKSYKAVMALVGLCNIPVNEEQYLNQ